MGKQPEARWTSLDVDLGLGRADDLAWAIGFASWGDPTALLAANLSAVDEVALPLDRTWSVVFAACILRGWLPRDEHTTEQIGDFLRVAEAEEARAIQNLTSRIEASAGPRLELLPPITGSPWPRVDARQLLSWALEAEAGDPLIAMPDVVRTRARTVATHMPQIGSPRPRPIAQEELPEFRSKSANALFTMFLALSFTTWGSRDWEDSEDLFLHIKELLKERPAGIHLEPFQLAVIKEAEGMTIGQFTNILANAEELFTRKSKVKKRATAISLGRAQTP